MDDDALKYLEDNPDKIDDMLIKARPGEIERQQNFVRKEPTSSQTTGTGNKGGQTKKNNAMQQYINDLNQDDQNSKKKKNNRFSNNRPLRDEFEFSHWREEFLWEVDKKYPEKVKEIKPMTGKNTITINPEDKSAKYKRGY